MKLIFLILYFYITISGDNVFAQKHKLKQENDEFIEQLANIAMKNFTTDYKLIKVEEIGNVSRTFVTNEIEIRTCNFNDLNQKKEIEEHPEKIVEWSDFRICYVCKAEMNKGENNTYNLVKMGCVIHDALNTMRRP